LNILGLSGNLTIRIIQFDSNVMNCSAVTDTCLFAGDSPANGNWWS